MGIRSLCMLDHACEKWTGELPGVNKHHESEEGCGTIALPDEAWGDITGLPLDNEEVHKARMLEMKYAVEKKVWVKIKKTEAAKAG